MTTLRPMHADALRLTTTDELIDHYAATTGLSNDVVLAIIKAGIDTLYTSRDAGGNMHSSGAAAGIEAVMAYQRATGTIPKSIPERFSDEYDPQPYTDAHGVSQPVEAVDVLDPKELHDYRQQRRGR